jgi:hypothetical protein
MMDHTGTAWLSMFNDQAMSILGISAGDLIQLKVYLRFIFIKGTKRGAIH